jgi:hypothetical protein
VSVLIGPSYAINSGDRDRDQTQLLFVISEILRSEREPAVLVRALNALNTAATLQPRNRAVCANLNLPELIAPLANHSDAQVSQLARSVFARSVRV